MGAGIKGSAIAAMFCSLGYSVTLLEQSTPAAGATSTNHGRLHLGVSSWRSDSPELTKRRLLGAELTRRLVGGFGSVNEAKYMLPSCSSDAELFIEFCRDRSVPFKECHISELPSNWIHGKHAIRGVSLPEYGFNPAKLCADLVEQVVRSSGSIETECLVTHVDSSGPILQVLCQDGRSYYADIVVNATSRWSDTIQPVFPDHKIEKHMWRILCCEKKYLPKINQVISVVDHRLGDPSVIPHERWVTFDCKTDFEVTDDANGPIGADWGLIDASKSQDEAISESASYWFPPLRDALKCGQVYGFTGIHGRILNAKPGSFSKCVEHPETNGYWLSIGGQASTAILDAQDAMFDITGQYFEVDKLLPMLGHKSNKYAGSMIWQNK